MLSWLTASNNNGQFVFSLNRRRYTTEILQSAFVLCVPVAGMEDLVRDVGSISGLTVNEFKKAPDNEGEAQNANEPISKRQRKKMLQETGIPNLCSVIVFENQIAIEGTVAQSQCKILQPLHRDDDHTIFLAQVEQARVRSDYWDPVKLMFRPDDGVAPYLTFFGSQTFGYARTRTTMDFSCPGS